MLAFYESPHPPPPPAVPGELLQQCAQAERQQTSWELNTIWLAWRAVRQRDGSFLQANWERCIWPEMGRNEKIGQNAQMSNSADIGSRQQETTLQTKTNCCQTQRVNSPKIHIWIGRAIISFQPPAVRYYFKTYILQHRHTLNDNTH